MKPLTWFVLLVVTSRAVAAETLIARPEYAPGKEIARLANGAIHESSGIACSRRKPDTFWTHNDSGDSARIFAFDSKGNDLGEYPIAAQAKDWEDIASATLKGKPLLLIADIGDNGFVRTEYRIVVVPEPNLDERKPAKPVPLVATAYAFTYGDQKAHNCESLAIDATDGRLYLMSKELKGPCSFFVLETPLCGAPEAKSYVAKKLADLDIGTATAMDMEPTGYRLIVLSGGRGHEWVRETGASWATTLAAKPRAVPLPPGNQLEGICYGPEGTTLWLTSETGKELPAPKTPLYQVPLKAKAGITVPK